MEEIEKKENGFVTTDGAGRYTTPTQEIIIDDEGNTKEYVFVLVKPQNRQMYSEAYLSLAGNKNYYEFAQKMLPKMINSPAEARKVDFFQYDPEALVEIISLMVDIMGKSSESKKRKLNMTLK